MHITWLALIDQNTPRYFVVRFRRLRGLFIYIYILNIYLIHWLMSYHEQAISLHDPECVNVDVIP